MFKVKNTQILFSELSNVFNKNVRCEKDLEKFIIHFLRYQAPHGEATARSIIKNLKDTGLLNSRYKLSPRRIGRGVLSDRSWFKGTKKYDPVSKQDLRFWRYEE